MFVTSFKNDYKDEINYIYMDDNNKFIGININKYGIGNFDYDSFNYFINNIKFNDHCFKIAKYQEYDVYFNPLTNYKHYIKDGKEDLLMFYLKNGNDALLYKSDDDNKSKRNKLKSFVFNFIQISLPVVIGSMIGINSQLLDIIDYKTYINDNNISYETVINYDNISVDDYIVKIMNGINLTDEEKKLLANEQLLMDITPYYNNTYMEKLINLKLNNIGIEFFAAEEHTDRDGYYNYLKPNILHISDRYKYTYEVEQVVKRRNDVFVHEFIHLLQSFSKYSYIKEGITEIIKKEYFDLPVTSYIKTVNNVQLLIDIIGPEPILKSNFSNSDKELENILADNLSLKEYKKIISYFSSTPLNMEDNIHEEINKLLCSLYRNMYGKDITEDKDILYDLFYSGKYECNNEKIYLNKSKMKDIEDFNVVVYGTPDELCEKGLLEYEGRKIIQRTISYEFYRKLVKQQKGMKCTYFYDSSNTEPYGDKYLINGSDIVTFKEAVELGYITIYETDSVDINDEIPEGFKCVSIHNYYYTNFDNLSYNSSTHCFDVSINGLKSRFNINYDLDKNKGIHM